MKTSTGEAANQMQITLNILKSVWKHVNKVKIQVDIEFEFIALYVFELFYSLIASATGHLPILVSHFY